MTAPPKNDTLTPGPFNYCSYHREMLTRRCLLTAAALPALRRTIGPASWCKGGPLSTLRVPSRPDPLDTAEGTPSCRLIFFSLALFLATAPFFPGC